jgi:hypothetical protein
MLAEARTGDISSSDSGVNPLVMDTKGNLMVAAGRANYFMNANRKKIFYAASQAATTWSVALNATHTGLVISNPAGSSVNLVPLKAGFALSVAPAAIAHVGFFGGYASGGIVTHTTPLTVGSTFINSPTGTGLADAAATLVGTPVWLMPFLGGFTAAALFATSPSVLDLEGMFIIPPGGYFGIAALTAVVGFAGITWEEVPV